MSFKGGSTIRQGQIARDGVKEAREEEKNIKGHPEGLGSDH